MIKEEPIKFISIEENKKLQEQDLTFTSEIVKAFPTQYYLAVSVVCDIRCPYCPRQYYMDELKQKTGIMDFDCFMNVAPYLRYAQYAGFFGLGEPFLNKRFFDFVKEAKAFNAYTATSTHGMSLKPEVCEQLVDLPLDEIAISLDTHKRGTFEYLREGAKYKVVRNNILYLSELKNKKGLSKPVIHIAAAISKFNVKHMKGMVKYSKKLGAVKVVFTNLIIVDKKNKDISVYGTPLFQKNLEKARALGEKIGIEVSYFPQHPFPWEKKERIFKGNEKFGCLEAWRTLAIERDGIVRPCCYLEESFGNAFKEPIADIINNEKFTNLRKGFVTGNLHPVCKSCENLQIFY